MTIKCWRETQKFEEKSEFWKQNLNFRENIEILESSSAALARLGQH